jgi:L-ascorbate metabolism protein UlaG (beta-lactamase superfamily)
MKLTYLFNSGFVIESERFMIILDYFKDTEEGFVTHALTSYPERIYVFASHWHPDHFNREVMRWQQQRPDIRYIFSDDIRKQMSWMKFPDVVFLDKGQAWEDDTLRVKAFGSTDVGISFLIEAEEKQIFHAGDLNNWHWNEESTPNESQAAENDFLNELAFLTETTTQLALAMFPVDPRLGKDYMRGAQQFVERIRTKVFAPMHFGDSYDKAQTFQSFAQAAGCRFIGWKTRGETIEIFTADCSRSEN